MKNRLLVMLIILILCVGCSSVNNGDSIRKNDHVGGAMVGMVLGGESDRVVPNIQIDGSIIFELDASEYRTNEFVNYKIENNTEMRLEFGSSVGFEMFVDQKWRYVNLINAAYTSIGYGLEPGKVFEGRHSLTMLKPGKYRLVKGVSTDEDLVDYETYLVSESFDVIQKDQ